MNIEASPARKWSGNSDTSDDGLSEERVEEWLDNHEEFVLSYFSRKGQKHLLDTLLRPKFKANRTSSPLPTASSLSGTSSAYETPNLLKSHSPAPAAATPPGCGTPVRKISSSELDRGFLKPILSHVDGIPSFLHFERLSRPVRQRKSKEELQELKILDEQALLMELVKDIANDLELTSLCHKILQNVSILTDGDRCSLFLVKDYGHESKMLVSQVYDVNADSCVEDINRKEEIVVPWGTGIIGHVAEHGVTLNIPDAYSVSSTCISVLQVYTFDLRSILNFSTGHIC